jgi:hypothetical protein
MKTSNPTRKNRTAAISRVCVLIALTGVATLTNINADEPGKKVHVNNAETISSADFSVSNEYKDYPQEVQDRLLEYRLNIALQDANESKPEIEPWMMDPSHWDKVLRKENTVSELSEYGQDNTNDTKENISDKEIKNRLVEYRLSVVIKEENDPTLEIEDWMVDNSHWSSVTEVALTDAIQEDAEPEYKLESWMLNFQSFSEARQLAKN